VLHDSNIHTHIVDYEEFVLREDMEFEPKHRVPHGLHLLVLRFHSEAIADTTFGIGVI
jgi:hypothetical protein